jgi:hypothetical protein
VRFLKVLEQTVATWELINNYVNQKGVVGSQPTQWNKRPMAFLGASSNLEAILARISHSAGMEGLDLIKQPTIRCTLYLMPILISKGREVLLLLLIIQPQEVLTTITGCVMLL